MQKKLQLWFWLILPISILGQEGAESSSGKLSDLAWKKYLVLTVSGVAGMFVLRSHWSKIAWVSKDHFAKELHKLRIHISNSLEGLEQRLGGRFSQDIFESEKRLIKRMDQLSGQINQTQSASRLEDRLEHELLRKDLKAVHADIRKILALVEKNQR